MDFEIYLSLLLALGIPRPLSVLVSQVVLQWLHMLWRTKSVVRNPNSRKFIFLFSCNFSQVNASLLLMYSTKSVTFVWEPNNRLCPGGPGGPGGPTGPWMTRSLWFCWMSRSRPGAGK